MIYFTLSVLVSAFLLFQVQPMIGKLILPWFGGTPAVWSTVMLYFQVLLTGGYAYAYWLIGRVRERRQGAVHLCLLVISAAALAVTAFSWTAPILPGSSWKPTGAGLPIWNIFKLLAVSVGLPYFLLSTNGPLMQAWFSRVFAGKSPYRLYALSNISSLLALISYPVLIEPWLPLKGQGWMWSAGYGLFVLLAGYGAWRAMRVHAPKIKTPSRETEPQAAPPSMGIRLAWLAFSAVASILLLATTNQITQEVAVIPFLWVLPLTIYLLTFVLTFSGERWYNRPLFTLLMLAAGIAFLWALIYPTAHIAILIVVYCLALFACCMVCHGELYRLRPDPKHLTSFYLMVSVGGALGGIAVNLIAPLIFKGYWELVLGMALCWLMLMAATFIRPTTGLAQRARFVHDVVIGAVAVSLVIFSVYYVSGLASSARFAARNFYGVIRVIEFNPDQPEKHAYALAHGITTHGFQFIAPNRRLLPTCYYTETGGGGLAILNHPRYGQGMKVGVLGLGIGTLAAYGQPGDSYRLYEINPIVIDLAEGEQGYFSYLADSRAAVTVIEGDARLALEHELAQGQPQNFDVLILDTFSSDSIPVHLATKEALGLYLAHLAPDGILAAHISTQHLDLKPVFWQLARYYGLEMALIYNEGDGDLAYSSLWVLLSRDPAILKQEPISSRAIPLDDFTTQIRLWSDDYSNLFQILR